MISFRNARSVWALIVGVGLYAALAGWILASSTAKLYGFSVQPGLHDLLAAMSQVCPLLAAFFFLALDTSARKLAGPVGAPFLLAAVFTTVVIADICWISRGGGAGLPLLAQIWSYSALLVDLLLVASFTSFVRWIARGPVLAVVIFLLYVVAIFNLGPKLGATAFIGFGSTPPTSLTVYSERPLGDETAWLFRLYWMLAVAVMIAIRYEARRRFRRPFALITAAAAFGLIGATLWKQTHPLAQPVPTGSTQLPEGRPVLSDYQLRLKYLPAEQRIAVDGELQFQNPSGTPLSTLWLEAPHLVGLHTLAVNRSAQITQTGLYRKVELEQPLAPGASFQLKYAGEIHASNAVERDRAKAKILASSFFLFHSDLLFAARRPGCLEGKGPGCTGGSPVENYLLVDRATGKITVDAPVGWMAVSVGDESHTESGRTTFTTPTPRLASFLVACARFDQTTAEGVSIFQPQNHRSESAKIGRVARGILDFYETQLPKLSTRHDLRVVVTPDYLGEAIAFEGLLAVSDRVITSRAADDTGPSSMVEFVMAHELAHQWWGYWLVPARAPGRAFAVESLAQFSAYCYAAERKILTREDAARNEERNYRIGKKHLARAVEEPPLARLEKEDYLAYHKGPYILLTLDAENNRSLLAALGDILRNYSAVGQEAVPPQAIVDELLSRLTPEARAKGREWLLATKTPEMTEPTPVLAIAQDPRVAAGQ